jgi:hypothetical protein
MSSPAKYVTTNKIATDKKRLRLSNNKKIYQK